MASDKILHLTKDNFAQTIAQGYTLVDFWATWCRPCTMLAPAVDQLADEYAGRVKVAKVDIDEQEALAVQYGVMSIPMLVLFKDGAPVDKSIGVVPKRELDALLTRNLG